jgi:hypothetical protein
MKLFLRANIRTFGFRTAPIMAGRGVKEGNNALNKVNIVTSLFDFIIYCRFLRMK